MKTPAKPPSTDEMFRDPGDGARLMHLVEKMSKGGASEQDYLPWDKLRFRTPPDGMTVREWWFLVRLSRRSSSRVLPALLQKDGRPFTFGLPDGVLKGVADIDRNASGRIMISEQVTNASTRDRYVVSSLIEEAITSSQLEGAATSRRVAKEMLRSGRKPSTRSELMIANNFRAMQRIQEIRDEAMTPELVCEIHRIVTDGTLDDPAGSGRIQVDDAQRVAVWGDGDQLLYRPPPVAELSDRLQRLCEFANGSDGVYLSPVLRAVAIHFMMGYDHYFEDGNGRTARAIFYWCLLRNGYWLAEFLTISKILKQAPSQYARSFLLTEDDDGDLTHFFLYHLGVINRSIDELHKYLAVKASELASIQTAVRQDFNHRQAAVIEHALKHPDGVYTVTGHAESHRVSAPTARSDLSGLAAKGLLETTRVARATAWRPAAGLAERLSRRD